MAAVSGPSFENEKHDHYLRNVIAGVERIKKQPGNQGVTVGEPHQVK